MDTPEQAALRETVRDFCRKHTGPQAWARLTGELGLTGPAFYRHYPSKEAVLVAILDDAISYHLQEVGDLARGIVDPREALAAIIANHVKFVFDQTANIVTWRTEFRSLPAIADIADQ